MIIGVTGTICAGIDSFGRILEEKGFKWFSYSDVIKEEAMKRGVFPTRELLQDLGDELRKNEGLGVLSKRILEKMEPSKNYVIGNIRNPGEVEELKKRKDFVLVMLDAPVELRFERLLGRARPGDPSSFEEFKKVEQRDFGIEQEDHGQQHFAVFKMAEKIIMNDSTENELRKKVEKLLEELDINV